MVGVGEVFMVGVADGCMGVIVGVAEPAGLGTITAQAIPGPALPDG